METTTEEKEYIDIYLTPRFFAPSDTDFKVHHILPIPSSPLLSQKWNYIFARFKVCYTDSDGDDITIGHFKEFLSAIEELRAEERECRFYVSRSRPGARSSLADFMNEMNQLKIRYEVTGNVGQGQLRMDPKSKRVTPYFPEKGDGLSELEKMARTEEEPVDPAISLLPISVSSASADDNLINLSTASVTTGPVTTGPNVQIGDNAASGDRPIERDDRSPTPTAFKPPERDDRSPTPTFPPVPSPTLHPLDRDSDDLLELPCMPVSPPLAPLPPAADSPIPAEMEVDDPPEQLPNEDEFPRPFLFPGSFPRDLDEVPSTGQSFQDRISGLAQLTMDYIARLGHITMSAAQVTGVPLTPERMDQNLHSLRQTLLSQREHLESLRRTLESNMRTHTETLRHHQGRVNRDVQAALHQGFMGAMGGISRAGHAVNAASMQVRSAMAQHGVPTERVDHILRDIGGQAERIDRAIHDVTLRIQQNIDATVRPQQQDQNMDEERSGNVEEDIYGVPLPGAFPVERNNIDECADKLIEMGFFTSEQRDMARSLSVVADGDLSQAVDLLQDGGSG